MDELVLSRTLLKRTTIYLDNVLPTWYKQEKEIYGEPDNFDANTWQKC